MYQRIINGVIKDGKIIPSKNLPKNVNDLEIKIIILDKNKDIDVLKRIRKFKNKWGDPVEYQKKIRKELGR